MKRSLPNQAEDADLDKSVLEQLVTNSVADTYRLAYIRSPEGIIVALAEQLG